VFLITCLGFTTFSINPSFPHFRCQVTGLLLLTSINFRWIMTQRLPSVSYLTLLDKYAIGCLFFLSSKFIWHSLIGSQIIAKDLTELYRIDLSLLYTFFAAFLAFNLIFLLWFLVLFFKIKSFKLKL
jgi:hypothetical protein